MAEIAADCLWLLRHKISRLDGLQVMIILTIVVYNIYICSNVAIRSAG